tara:strand:- start:945 stop:1985 length:1041 start_codon:yes stop_codon:yes gene_type:complete
MPFKERKVADLNNAIGDIICRLAVKGRSRLIGSNSLRALSYGSDYDAEAIVKGTACDKVASMIKDAYLKTARDPNVWITDFKAGWDDRLVYKGDFSKSSVDEYLSNHLIKPVLKKKIARATGDVQETLINDLWKLRWTVGDMKRGWVKLIDGKRKYFKETILEKTPLKIDLIIKVGDQFKEVSENYYITCDGKTNFVKCPSKKEVEEDYEEEIKYFTKINSFKALKRLFSLFRYDGAKKHKDKMDKLVVFFNSNVGFANKIKNELDILECLLEQKRKPKWEDVVANLQFIKEQFSHLPDIGIKNDVFNTIDNITPTSAYDVVGELRDYIAKLVNSHSKDFLRYIMK